MAFWIRTGLRQENPVVNCITYTVFLFVLFLLLFSRLASDLLLWEPMAPSPADRPDPSGFNIGTGLDLASQMMQAQGPDRFVMCRSGLRSYDDGK